MHQLLDKDYFMASLSFSKIIMFLLLSREIFQILSWDVVAQNI